MRARLVVAAALAGIALAAWQRQRVSDDELELDAATPEDGASAPASWSDYFPDFPSALDAANPFAMIERAQATTDAGDGNVAAFLSMLAYSEGTARERDPYRVCYGYRHTIADLSDHPAVTGEWRGESLANLGPAYAGKVSTAAGRYQIIRPTWLAAKRALGLVDFGPAAQDAAAVWLITRRGALEDIKAGRLAAAVAKCAAEWASLPGAGAGQPERKLASLESAYSSAGGFVA